MMLVLVSALAALGYFGASYSNMPDCKVGDEAGVIILDTCYALETTDLNLSGTVIADASPLSGLTSLKRLQLIGTQITDMGPLRPLINLHRLRPPDGTKVGNYSFDNLKNRKAVADYIAAHSK